MDVFKILGRIAIEGADKAKKDVAGVGGEAQVTADKTSKAGNTMVSAFKKVGGAIAAYLSVNAIKEFGLACVQAAADAEAMQAQFSSVFGDVEKDAQKALSNIAKEAGISENRMKGSFTKIAAFAKTSGMDTESSLSLAERAMRAVADSAAFYDRSLEETTESLQSFLKGNYENDAALGLSATETTRNAAANKLYGKSFKKLSEEQKQLTLLQMVEDANKLSGALGQAARESDTWNNVTGNLKQGLTDFKATIGKHILPTVIDLGKKFVGFVETVTKKVDPTVEWLKDNFKKLSDKAKEFRDWLSDIGSHIANSFAPSLESLKNGFRRVKDAAQPLIDKVIEIKDKFVEYVKSGEGAKDATQLLKDGIEELAGFVETVIEKLADFSKWCSENQGTIETIAIVVGSFAAAWGLVNGAVALWEGVATAGAIATGLLELATWGLGTAIAFLTSPITIAVAIIGALIAIGVLLWKNWDTVKAKCSEMWELVKEKFADLKDAVVEKVSELKDKVTDFFTNLVDKAKEKFEQMKSDVSLAVSNAKNTVVDTFQQMYNSVRDKVTSVYNTVRDKFNSVKNAISSAVSNAKQTAVDTFQQLYNSVSDKVTAVYNKVKEKFDSVKNAISDAINSAKNAVSNAVDAIKRAFDFKLKLDISWPEIKVSGGKAPWGIGGEGYPPSIDIDWHAKAMQNAMILKDPTIFGYSGGKYLGGGEAGNEVVAGETHLMKLIASAVANQTGAQNEQIVTALYAILEAVANGNNDIVRAVLEDKRFAVGEREFARLVRTYA